MEIGLKAFFYEYKYYLLPDGCADAEDVRKLKMAEVRRLKEENCMAPDFVYESAETEFLVIAAPELIFPATVNLYTREEYDALLSKQVEKRCPGCLRYTDDGSEELTGHHREISLAGVCYSREEKGDFFPFGCCVQALWSRLAKEVNDLATMIETGDQKGLEKRVNREIEKFFLPLEVYGGVSDGKYCLCLGSNGYPQQGLRAVLKMFADTANKPACPMAEAGWRVYPYFPKGVYKPALRPDYFKRPPRIFYSEEAETGAAEIAVYEKDAESWSAKKTAIRKKAIYGYLCHYVGEDVLLAGSASIAVAGKLPEDKREVSAEELAGIMEERTKDIFEGEAPFPAPLYLRADGAELDTLPFKENVQTWATVCPEMSPENLPEDPPHNTLFEGLGIIYAYLYLPGVTTEEFGAEKKEVLDWYMSHADEYPAPITFPGSWEIFVKNVGVVFTPSGLCEDCMVFDEKEFFRVMRNLAPVLEGLNVKIVTVKRDGVIVYEPGYVIRHADAGILA